MPYRKELKKVAIFGSGPIVIGQAAEFDYAGTQACLALKEEGIEVVLINHNPATIMTDESIADVVYMEPMTVENVTRILEKEQPDGVIGSLGGQTGLNLTINLYEDGVFERLGIEVLGTSVESIQQGEDREQFRKLMRDIGEPISESKIATTLEEALQHATAIGYPIMIRPAYTLGGEGGGFAYSADQLTDIVERGLSLSPISQVLIERSMRGWKEIEYEVMRDEKDTCMIVCNMENVDPVGIHTGDSIVVAPSQTLTDNQYQLLRNVSIKVIRALGVIGGCNIQFGLDPESDDYQIIEVNPRVSRSSALASKATGYPIARMAAKCSIGYALSEIPNPITETTTAAFEPALDYLVVKLPRFPFDKFPEGERSLGTQMKATGEVMALDRSFEGALNKAIRSMETHVYALSDGLPVTCTHEQLVSNLTHPTDERLFYIAEAFKEGWSVEDVHAYTFIDYWFLNKIKRVINVEQLLLSEPLSKELLLKAKRLNISDGWIAKATNKSEEAIRSLRKAYRIQPGMKQVDTCAAEFEAMTPYYYSTYLGEHEGSQSSSPAIVILGSGPIRIGQGIEFDYASVKATMKAKELGYRTVVINNNPETVSTDFSVADTLYFEPLTAEDVLAVIDKEHVAGVAVQFGGQSAISLASELERAGVPILGTSVSSIHLVEDRGAFYSLLQDLEIPSIPGGRAWNKEQLVSTAKELAYPLLVRPSYVTGGQHMQILSSEYALQQYVDALHISSEQWWPLLLDSFIEGKECEVDVICNGNEIVIPGIMEHLERAGVHSGDSTTVYPPQTIDEREQQLLVAYARKLSEALGVQGLMNIQYVIQDGMVYVLEVNPRASRTVPVISKVTGIDVVGWAMEALLPAHAKFPVTGLVAEKEYVALKRPIYSARKLKGVDHAVGPNMKSTGETLTLSETMDQLYATHGIDSRDLGLLVSMPVSKIEEALPHLERLVGEGTSLYAPKGSYQELVKHNVPVIEIEKEASMMKKAITEKRVQAVLSLPHMEQKEAEFGSLVRELAVNHGLQCFTHLDQVQWITNETQSRPLQSMQEWLAVEHHIKGDGSSETTRSQKERFSHS